MGTNWVPLDAFHSRDKERLPMALELLGESGCNAVRLWGGNVYRLKDNSDWSREGGFWRYGLEKVVGNNGTESDDASWNTGANSFSSFPMRAVRRSACFREETAAVPHGKVLTLAVR